MINDSYKYISGIYVNTYSIVFLSVKDKKKENKKNCFNRFHNYHGHSYWKEDNFSILEMSYIRIIVFYG